MGYTTDFLGWVQIDPPLNEHETEYLRAYNRTRRWDRPEGRFVVLPHPLSDDEHGSDVDAYNRPAAGEPGLWCPWTVTTNGTAIAHDGHEKAYDATRWLEYLIRTFLQPEAAASHVDDLLFEAFTFDHVCDGAIASCRRDTGQVAVMFVTDNEVDERVLLPGIPEGVIWADLPYEPEMDRHRNAAAVRRAAYDERLVSRVG